MADLSENEHSQPKGLWVDYKIKVSTYDTDFAGHVSNIAYLRWLEDMRLHLFDKYFPLQGFLREGKTPVIASTHIDYKRSVRMFDDPYGVMWVSRMGNASLTMEAELYVRGTLTTKAKHVGVFIDSVSGKPVRLPPICVDLFRTVTDVVPVLR